MAIATIAGVGDLVPYRRLAFPNRSLYAVLEGAFAIGNLEVPLTKVEDPQRSGIVLGASPAVVPDLARAGLNAASLANNHSGDHGTRGLEDTARNLAQHHLMAFG